MSDTNFLAGQASLWVQPDGPNTKPLYLGCHAVGDIAEPFGDETTLYCPDPAQAGKFIAKSTFSGQPGSITTSITTDIRKTQDYLETVGKCKIPIYIHKVSCGRRDVFTNYDRTFILRQARITNKTLSNLAVRSSTDEGESTQAFDFSALAVDRVFNLQTSRISIAEVSDVTGIAICGEERCENNCGATQQIYDDLYVASKSLVGSAADKAQVWHSSYQGVFGACAADPFGAGESIQGIACFRIGKNTSRVVVARGTTDAGNPAEIAYSDNAGATWNLVNVGSHNGEYVAASHALIAVDAYHMWIGTDHGRIYFSDDGGLTWTLQEDAVISATAITGLDFHDISTGFAVYTGGQVAKSADGVTWGGVTVSGSAAATDIDVITPYFLWVVGTDGMFYSHDAGLTWSKRNSNGVAAVDFLNELEGVAVGSASSGLVWMTINGGYDWSALTLMTNAGYLDVHMVSPTLSYITGKVQGGTGMVAKLLPVSA